MSVANGELANQDTFNGAFMSREINTDTVGKVDLKNADSGQIIDVQRELNAIARYTGKSTNTAVTTPPAWGDNTIGASGDSLFQRIGAVQSTVSTALGAKSAGGVLYGQFQQDLTHFFYNSASAFLGVNTNTPSANFEVDGSLALRSASAAIAASAIAQNEHSFIRITSSDATALKTIPAPIKNADQVKVIANVTGSNIVVNSTGNILTSTTTVTLSDKALLFLIWDRVSAKWRILAGGGGGGAAVITNFDESTTTLTASSEPDQVWRYTTTTTPTAITLSAIDFTLLPQGGRLTITSQEDSTYPVTVPATLTSVKQNGDWVGSQYSIIVYQRIGPRIIEVSRNGI